MLLRCKAAGMKRQESVFWGFFLDEMLLFMVHISKLIHSAAECFCLFFRLNSILKSVCVCVCRVGGESVSLCFITKCSSLSRSAESPTLQDLNWVTGRFDYKILQHEHIWAV